MKLSHLLIVALLLPTLAAAADSGPVLRDAGSLGGIRLAGSEDPNLRKVYIVQLALPSAAEHHAKARTTVTKPGVGGLRSGHTCAAVLCRFFETYSLARRRRCVDRARRQTSKAQGNRTPVCSQQEH